MSKFKDTEGREWSIALDAPTIREVREACDFDLVSDDGKLYERLSEDPVKLIEVLWTLCKGQHASVEYIPFAKSMVGDAIEHATDALLEAVANFFPARKRSLLLSLAKKQRAAETAGMELAAKRLDDPNLLTSAVATMESRMDEALKPLIGATGATKSAANSESESKD